MSQVKEQPARPPEPQRHPLEPLMPLAHWVLRASFLVLVLALAYIAYGLLRGAVPALNDPRISSQDKAQILQTVHLAGAVCMVAAIVLSLSILVIHFEDKETTIYVGALAAFFYFGLPFVMGYLISRAASSPSGDVRKLADDLRLTFGHTGLTVLAVFVIKGFANLIQSAREMPGESAKHATVGVAATVERPGARLRRPTVFSPCWELPYCRENVKKICPAFVARKRCWKFGRGCYCDEEMIERIVRGETGDGAPKRRVVAQAYARADMTDRAGPVKKGQKAPCKRCYIFIEHQNLKHRFLSPIGLPITIAVIYVLRPFLQQAYELVVKNVGPLWARLTYQVGGNAPGPAEATLNTYTQMIILFLLGCFILIYVTRFVEYCVYKLHL